MQVLSFLHATRLINQTCFPTKYHIKKWKTLEVHNSYEAHKVFP